MTPPAQFGFGCVGLTMQPTAGAAVRLLHAAHACGLAYFDTAPTYGRGYSEILLGRFLRETREPVRVATKFGLGHLSPALPAALALPLQAARRNWRRPPAATDAPPPPATLLVPRVITRRAVAAAFDQSRRVLGRERIDCYLLHEGLPAFLEAPAWEFLQEQRRAGTIGALGVAAGGHNYQALAPGDLHGWDVLQYESGPAWPGNAPLRDRFPGLRHIFHSCLKSHRQFGPPAALLREAAARNPGGMVLFSTGHPAHLRANLAA